VTYEEDNRAVARRDLGLLRELEQVRSSLPEPSQGGGYPVWFRVDELVRADNGEETRASAASILQ
jgi:hypothetical protein